MSSPSQASHAFAVPPPSAPPHNPLWGSFYMSSPRQQTMGEDAIPFDHFEWRGGEMLSVKHNNSEVLYFRRHTAAGSLHPCVRRFDFFRTVDSSISYQVKGKCCCQTYHLAVNNEEVANLNNATWCENGIAFACGLVGYSPPIATLGTISVRGTPRFRILRKVDKDGSCECPCAWTCKQEAEYAVVNQPIFDALNSVARGTKQSDVLLEQIKSMKEGILEQEMSAGADAQKQLKTMRTQEKRLSDELKSCWQQSALLKPAARSESLLRRVGCFLCNWWEPVRVMVTPETTGFTSDEIRAAGLLSIAHIARGLNGPLLRAKDDSLGAARHQFTFNDMLQHQQSNEIGKDAASRYTASPERHFPASPHIHHSPQTGMAQSGLPVQALSEEDKSNELFEDAASKMTSFSASTKRSPQSPDLHGNAIGVRDLHVVVAADV